MVVGQGNVLHWFWIPREPGVLKMCYNVVAIFLNDSCQVHEVSYGVNECKIEEFHIIVWV